MIILGLLVSIIYSSTVVINPYLSKILVDDAIKAEGGPNKELLVRLVVIMTVVVFVRTVILFIRKMLFEDWSNRLFFYSRMLYCSGAAVSAATATAAGRTAASVS